MGLGSEGPGFELALTLIVRAPQAPDTRPIRSSLGNAAPPMSPQDMCFLRHTAN